MTETETVKAVERKAWSAPQVIVSEARDSAAGNTASSPDATLSGTAYGS